MNAGFYILYKLVWAKNVPSSLLIPQINDRIILDAPWIGNSLVSQNHEQFGLQAINGLDLVCKAASFSYKNETR